MDDIHLEMDNNPVGVQDEIGVAEPCVGMEFDSEKEAKSFYDEYARQLSFTSKPLTVTTDSSCAREFVCSSKRSRRRPAEICDAMLRIELKGGVDNNNKWVVTKFVKEHSHGLATPTTLHCLRPRRHFASSDNSNVPSGMMYYAEEGAATPETYNIAFGALREGGKKVSAARKSVGRAAPPSSHGGDAKTSLSASDSTPLLWPRQDEMTRRFKLNDGGARAQSVADLNLPRLAPVSLHRDDGAPENMVALPCLKSMTWGMESKNTMPGGRVAVINLKLHDYRKFPSADMEVKFQLSSVTLEPMLRSMAYISEQLSAPANRVAVINLKLQDTETTTGESEVKFQVSRDTLGAMLRSMAYIREQLSVVGDQPTEPQGKKQRKH
ncbi:hypothetical protein HID58_052614 [Brassica napus]|uniref:Protein FAR1-RELATED SEQUENCE n=1 Tax=Brassica napus TaxID=3708 RepID=A0ABQ8ADQ8_BRANA|nr:hypothetical protein HID58_052614 [Brassica napus]